jgi:hypothetical protein
VLQPSIPVLPPTLRISDPSPRPSLSLMSRGRGGARGGLWDQCRRLCIIGMGSSPKAKLAKKRPLQRLGDTLNSLTKTLTSDPAALVDGPDAYGIFTPSRSLLTYDELPDWAKVGERMSLSCLYPAR